PVLCHESIGDRAVFAERASGADLISAHKPGIPGDISRQHCRQSSLYPPAGHKGLSHCHPNLHYQSIGVGFLPVRLEPDFSDSNFRLGSFSTDLAVFARRSMSACSPKKKKAANREANRQKVSGGRSASRASSYSAGATSRVATCVGAPISCFPPPTRR